MSAGVPGTDDLIKDTTLQAFREDVLEASIKQPVLVDFWAPWCGPCKQLTPLLEKAVRAAGGKVKLVKMDIDKYPQVAGQLGVQSIPAVFAFSKGQPVDGFMGALPESQIKAFIEKLTGPIGPSSSETILAAAEALLCEGETDQASRLFAQAFEESPDSARAIAGLARCALEKGELEQARTTLSLVPADKANDPAILSVQASLELAEQAAKIGDLGELSKAVETDPANHQARFDLALGLAGRGERAEAVEHLLTIVRRNRQWNEDGARKQLVQFFEAWGPTDQLTIEGRRRLSSILFA